MKQKMNFAQISRTLLWLSLIVFACFAAARAQVPNGTVIPIVCFESKPETLTRTLAVAVNAGGIIVTTQMNQAIPVGFYRVVFNPGGATEESFPISRPLGSQSSSQLKLSPHSNASEPPFRFAHAAGETIVLTTDGPAVFGYNNLGSTVRNIPRGVSTENHFQPATTVYPGQPSVFQPGIHENIFSVNVISSYTIAWTLEGRQATSTAGAEQGCATITYQGRLSDAGNAANGQFDLQFQSFDAATGGAAQSELITLQDVQVTNGIFTVPLNFGSTFSNNLKSRFLEIGVRAGSSTGAFTTLTPRQPLTQVPYAVNAQTAQTALNVTTTNGFNIDGGTLNLNRNMLQLGGSGDAAHGLLYNSAINGAEFRGLGGFVWKTGANGATERMSLDGAGNLGVAGNLTVNGTINGTVTNAAQLGGAPPSNYFKSAGGVVSGNVQATGDIGVGNNLIVTGNGTIGGNLTVGGTVNGNFGQSVATADGTGSLSVTSATTAYTLIPGLTQTVNVPANSSLLISTDGGIVSTGAVNSYSVIDVAVFVDGALIGARRIVISNFPLPASVGNWALNHGQTLAPGSHTIEVRARHGFDGSATSTVSSSSDTLLRGQLTVAVIKK